MLETFMCWIPLRQKIIIKSILTIVETGSKTKSNIAPNMNFRISYILIR